jgi:PAS domain S-box-containing protein
LQQLLERLPVAAAIHALDAAGSVVFVNESFVRTFGYTRDEIPTAREWAERAYPDAAYRREVSAAWEAAVAKAHAESGGIEPLEFRVACKDGTVRDVAFSASVVGRVLMVMLIDVTRHRETERSLQVATERMRLAAAAAGFGFWTRDLDAEVEEWDDQMLRVYGLEREEFCGRWEPHVHPDDLARVQEETRRSIEQGVSGQFRYRIIHPDGSVRHVKGASTTIRDSRGRPTHELGVNFDVTTQWRPRRRSPQPASRSGSARRPDGTTWNESSA